MEDNSPNSPNKESEILEKLLPSNIISEVDSKEDKGVGNSSNLTSQNTNVIQNIYNLKISLNYLTIEN